MDDDPTDGGGSLRRGNRIRITAGVFENFEAVVVDVDPATGRITAHIVIYGRATPVELGPGEAVRVPWQPDRQ